jgi:hypothetical protein
MNSENDKKRKKTINGAKKKIFSQAIIFMKRPRSSSCQNVQVLATVFSIITQFAGSSSIILAITCKDLVKYAYHLHPKFDDLWKIRCSQSRVSLTPMKVISYLEWGPWGFGTYYPNDNIVFSLNFLDVLFEVEFEFWWDRRFWFKVSCPNFVRDKNDSSEDDSSDEEYPCILHTSMFINCIVPHHEIRKTLFPCFQSVYETVKKYCLKFLNMNPQCLVSKNIQDAAVIRTMDAECWAKVAQRWKIFETTHVEHWEENPKDVFYFK